MYILHNIPYLLTYVYIIASSFYVTYFGKLGMVSEKFGSTIIFKYKRVLY
jgi:hypothetical protein